MQTLPPDLICWVLSDGKPGMENQCLGLAEALGLSPVVKRVAIRNPWRSLPPQLWFAPMRALSGVSDRLTPPWPDLLIATGRQTVAPALAIRKASRGRTFTVQIQNPVVSPDRFDLVVAPRHDRLTGANVLQTYGGLNRLSQTTLKDAGAQFAPDLAHLPRPLLAVLIGGSNKVYRMTDKTTRTLAEHLRTMAETSGCGLALTASRRTGPENLGHLKQALSGLPAVWYDGDGPNPYLGWLALADAFVATSDSVNMVSEACSTGKPVFVHHLPGGNAKFDRFHTALAEAGMTRPLAGDLAHWTYPPLNDTATIAEAVATRLSEHLLNLNRGQE